MRSISAFLTFFLAATALADAEVERSIRSVIPAKGVEHVEVDFSVGEVEIRSGPAAQIEIAGLIRREYDEDSARDRERAKEIVNDLNIEVTVRGDRAMIRERRGGSARFGRGRWVDSEVDLRITLPAGVNLRVEHSVGELEISGDFRDVEVRMRVGELTVRLPKRHVKELSAGTRIGEVRADLGDRVLRREGLFPGSTHFVSEKGTSRIDLRLTIGEIDVELE